MVSERDRERGQHSTDTHSGEETDRNRMRVRMVRL